MPMQIDGEPWMQAAAEVNMFFSLGNLVILRKLIRKTSFSRENQC